MRFELLFFRPPKITVPHSDGLTKSQVSGILQKLNDKAKERIGNVSINIYVSTVSPSQEMIFDLVTCAQNCLKAATTSDGTTRAESRPLAASAAHRVRTDSRKSVVLEEEEANADSVIEVRREDELAVLQRQHVASLGQLAEMFEVDLLHKPSQQAQVRRLLDAKVSREAPHECCEEFFAWDTVRMS